VAKTPTQIVSCVGQFGLTGVPSLPAGEYVFLCDLHPEMRGTVVSQ
jgi:plastocyanin